MHEREAKSVLLQLEHVIDQSHWLQLELLELYRAMSAGDGPVTLKRMPGTATRIPTAPPVVGDAPAASELPDKSTFSVREAAAILGVGRNTAYRCVRTGQIPAVRLGQRLLVPTASLARMLGGSSGKLRVDEATPSWALSRGRGSRRPERYLAEWDEVDLSRLVKGR